VTSETSTEDREEPTDEGGEPEHIQIHAPEVDALAARAELLHLPHDEPMATQTQTQVREEPLLRHGRDVHPAWVNVVTVALALKLFGGQVTRAEVMLESREGSGF
jgi:hypothetical protein